MHQVVDQRYAKQAESILREHLTSFLAPKGPNAKEIINETSRGNVSITVTQFRNQTYNIPPDRLPEPRFLTAHKVLEFSDPNAEMAFINQVCLAFAALLLACLLWLCWTGAVFPFSGFRHGSSFPFTGVYCLTLRPK